jgi:two-component system, NarL family, sensor histidine kinase DesK
MTRAEAAVAGIAGDPPRQATAITMATLVLFLALKVGWAAGTGGVDQLPWVVALFVLPLLYAFPPGRSLLTRHRWAVLAAQAALTFVPFAIFTSRWVVGIGGLLAGLVLLMLPGRVSWPVAGFLLATDVVVRAAVTGLPFASAWPGAGALWAIITFVDDTLAFFGMVRLAQIVGDVGKARRHAADLAVARERLQAARSLQSALGERLAGISSMTTSAQRALARDAAQARAQITAAGVAAREAIARAREVTVDRRSPSRLESATDSAKRTVIGARLAWAVVVAAVVAVTVQGFSNISLDHDSPRRGTVLAVGLVLAAALQLRHSWSARQGGKPRGWPVTLGLQAVLAYAFFLPSLALYTVTEAFLAGSVLLLVPGRWRWAGYAAVVVSWTALFATVPLHGIGAADRGAFITLNEGGNIAFFGLLVYGLSWMAGQARQLESLRGDLAWAAVVRERLRVARDVHDLLGLGLSAVALKADLIGALIGRDDARAAVEIGEMGRVCAVARADIRLVTGQGRRLSLADELAAAEQILVSAGVQVSAGIPPGSLPPVADEVLAPVLREAVTNVLRHAIAATCVIEVTVGQERLRLHVGNDGITGGPAPGRPTDGGGRGLANLSARVQAADGQLTWRRVGDRFDLFAMIPLASELAPVG